MSCRQGVQNDTKMSAFADMSLHVGNSFELKHKKCILSKDPYVWADLYLLAVIDIN